MIDMSLKIVRGLSYSQLYPYGKETIEELVSGLPTCDSVVWLSYIVNLKQNLTIDETDIHILAPLMFSFEPDLQHRITDFLGSFVDRSELYVNVSSLLDTVKCLLSMPNKNRHKLSKEEKTRLFKAYLIECDNYLAGNEMAQKSMNTPDGMLHYYMPWAMKTNTVGSIKEPMMELAKGKLFLIDFASQDKDFSNYVKVFLLGRHCSDPSMYLEHIFSIVSELTTKRGQRTNIIRADKSSAMCDFLDNLSINTNDSYWEGSDPNIQEYPVFKVDSSTYCILYIKFFTDKLFHSMIFDMASILSKKQQIKGTPGQVYVQLKQMIGQRFTEKYLFYLIMKGILTDKRYQIWTGEQLKQSYGDGMPDMIAIKAQRVFVFEFKDVQLSAKVKESGDFDTIISKINLELVQTEKGKPKGVTQIANVIEKRLEKLLPSNEKFKIYPVLVYTESSFDLEGINYYLNNKFREILSSRNIDDNFCIKDLVLVNLDTLFMFDRAFRDHKLKFDVLINDFLSYKTNKIEHGSVPFNKFLFQRGKAKGYFYKSSGIVRETMEELSAYEREYKSKEVSTCD